MRFLRPFSEYLAWYTVLEIAHGFLGGWPSLQQRSVNSLISHQSGMIFCCDCQNILISLALCWRYTAHETKYVCVHAQRSPRAPAAHPTRDRRQVLRSLCARHALGTSLYSHSADHIHSGYSHECVWFRQTSESVLYSLPQYDLSYRFETKMSANSFPCVYRWTHDCPVKLS